MIGDIVFCRFPFADQARFKSRPCLVISQADELGDLEVLKITSKQLEAPGRIPIRSEDFLKGGLAIPSAVVSADLAKTHVSAIVGYAGQVRSQLVQAVLKARIGRNTRTFSRLAHTANRPGDDALRPENTEKPKENQENTSTQTSSTSTGTQSVPYAGRVFTEDEVEAAVSATLDFWLTLGPEGEAFEKELAQFLGVKHSLLVNSGSSANLIALSCLTTHKLPEHKRIRPGDEIITCAAGFPTTVAPIVQNGCIPVFIDNDPTTGNARVEQLEAAYSPGKTKAVMMAHTLGNPFNIAAILAFCKKYDLWLIEDNCDALGCTYTMPVEMARDLGLDHLLKIAEKNSSSFLVPRSSLPENQELRTKNDEPRTKNQEPRTKNQEPRTKNQEHHVPFISNGLLTAYTGSFGDLSTQSFYPPHHLTMGEGGAVNIIRRPPLKTYAESFRDWGRDCWCPSGKDNTCGKRFGWNLGELPTGYDHKYIYSHLGYNLKPLDPQAAIGRVQLRRLPAFIEARKQNWETLRRGLADLEHLFEFSLPTHATAWLPPGGSLSLSSQSLSPETPTSLQNTSTPAASTPAASTPAASTPAASTPATSTQATSTSTDSEAVFSWDSSQCRTDCSWFGFMLRVKPEAPFTVREFAAYLDEHKIGNRMLFGGNLLRQPVFVQLRKDNPAAFRVVGEADGSLSLSGQSSSNAVLSDTSTQTSSTSTQATSTDSEAVLSDTSASTQATSTSTNSHAVSDLSTFHFPPSTFPPALPGADEIMHTALFLGTYPGLSPAQLDYEIAVIRDFVGKKSGKLRAET